MESVGGSVLSAFFSVLFDRMATPEFLDLLVNQKIDSKLLQKLKTYLTTVSVVLHDAEYRQIALKDASVKNFLDDLRDAAYKVDDLLDLIAYEVTAVKIQAHQCATAGNLPWNLSSLCKPLSMKAGNINNLEQVSIPSGVAKKIEEIVEILEILVKQIDPLGLKKKNKKDVLPQREPTSPVVEEAEVFGRNGEKDALIKSLKAADKNGIGVIPIVGMGGIGKTTLARLLYNNTEVKKLFAIRAWVCVSDNYDGLKIKKELLQQVNISVKCDDLSPQQIGEELKKSLGGKKYFIVLDDIWKIGYDDWNNLQEHLKSGDDGSKIIVTTRIEDTSKMVRTDKEHHLKMLSDDSCWQLFKKHAFIDGEENQNVQSLREKILSKCGGLPLAAKMLGGVMRGKQMVEWEEILTSEMWKIDCGVIPALMLSYQYLPSHLKQCFAYCAIFPQDYKIRKDELIQLWTAECFLVKPRGERKSLAKLAEEYFQELVSRYFFQEHNDEIEGSYFLMHDHINDLALLISGDFLVKMDEGNSCDFSARNRYFSFKISKENSSNIPGSISKAQLLRTFWSFDEDWVFEKDVKKIVDKVFNVLRCLRVLSFRYFDMVKLPKSIKHLKHLRYLNLAHTDVKRLPKAVCSLYNLQTLILYGCSELVELPKNIGSLINLHTLDIRRTQSLKKMPPGLGNLKDLRTLGKFIVGKGKGSTIDELGKLQHLCGELQICDLQNAAEIPKDILKNKKHLKDLRLEWTHMSDNKVVVWEHEERVLQRLQPYGNIIKLSISRYGGKKLPDWIGDSFYASIVSLELNGCKHCTFLPAFDKLSSLKHLSISNCDSLTKVSMTKPLCSLETLSIENMGQWESWCFCEENDGGKCGGLTSLEKLTIRYCPKLNAISPSGSSRMIFYSLNCLIVVGCPNIKIFNLVAISSFKQLAKENKPPISPRLSEKYLGNEGVVLQQLPSGMYSLYAEKLMKERIEEMGIALNGLEEIMIRGSELCESIPLEVFTELKFLVLKDCDALKSLSASGEQLLQPLMYLASLKISHCKSLIYFPKGGISAPNMTYLELDNCTNLKSLPENMNVLLSSLKDLKIGWCRELESFPNGGLPMNLQSLQIMNCDNLNYLPFPLASTYLSNSNCENLESYLQEGLTSSSSDVDTETPSSQQKGLLPNLHSLHIEKCDKLIGRRQQWGLQRFNALSNLSLVGYKGDDLSSFPEESLFPSTLTSLEIDGFENLEVINYKGLQHLTSLSQFEISRCSNLRLLPEVQHLTSLTEFEIYRCSNLQLLPELQNLTSLFQLRIGRCYKLRCLPEGSLPSSISDLQIWGCPSLKKRCEREKGKDWPKISQIPTIDIS